MLNIELGLLQQIGDIARRAGREIMNIYKTEFKVEAKDDSSPVTEADKTAEDLILRSIREGITGEFPIVSEEAAVCILSVCLMIVVALIRKTQMEMAISEHNDRCSACPRQFRR